MNASRQILEYSYDKHTKDFSYKKKIVFGVDCKRNPNLKHETKDRLKSEVQANTAI